MLQRDGHEIMAELPEPVPQGVLLLVNAEGDVLSETPATGRRATLPRPPAGKPDGPLIVKLHANKRLLDAAPLATPP